MIVSVYSNAVVADARAAGGLHADNVNAAMSRVNAFAGDIDVQETMPTRVAVSASGEVSSGAKMSLALGADSESRTGGGHTVTESTGNIVAQAANGDTLAYCHAGAGDVVPDGTLGAPAASACSITQGAAAHVTNPLNRSGITSLAQLTPSHSIASTTAVGSAATCGERAALLASNLALFDSRKNALQAKLLGGLTQANWATHKTASSWGPLAAQYGPISAPSGCADIATFQRELVMAVENYWVDQNINYCHHHVPGWLPPDDSAEADPKYRNASAGSTSGTTSKPAQRYGMTCTAQRDVDGSQVVQGASDAVASPLAKAQVQWHGVDCSDFTAWVYNFAGLTNPNNGVETAISTQACMTPQGGEATQSWAGPAQAGILLDINHGNFDTTANLLAPGDLLYIELAPPKGWTETPTSTIGLSHVVTWTGKTWRELRNGPEGWRYDPALIGQPSSRLGGDIARILGSDDVLGTLEAKNPYMIIDSHYAGPAYRPFVGWYRTSLSNVRRIVNADAAFTDSSLQDLIIRQQPVEFKPNTIVLMSNRALAKGGSVGYQLRYQNSATGSPTCMRQGVAS